MGVNRHAVGCPCCPCEGYPCVLVSRCGGMGQFPVSGVTVEIYYEPDFPFDDGIPYASGLTDSAGKFCFAHPGIAVADAVVIKDYDWCHISAPPIVRRNVAIGTCDVLPFWSDCGGGANPGWHGSYTVDTPSICTLCCWPHCTPKALKWTGYEGITRNFTWNCAPYPFTDVSYQDCHWSGFTQIPDGGTVKGTCGTCIAYGGGTIDNEYFVSFVDYHMKCCRDVYGNHVWVVIRRLWTGGTCRSDGFPCNDLFGSCKEAVPQCASPCSWSCDACRLRSWSADCCTRVGGYGDPDLVLAFTPYQQEVVPLSLISCCPFAGSATFGGMLPETVTFTEPP